MLHGFLPCYRAVVISQIVFGIVDYIIIPKILQSHPVTFLQKSDVHPLENSLFLANIKA